MTPMQQMADYAAAGQFALQRCAGCGHCQYPPRTLCSHCLGDELNWHVAARHAGEVLAVTTLHHSHDPAFRARLPLLIALVRMEDGPSVVCFLAADSKPGARVSIVAGLDAEGRAVLSATL